MGEREGERREERGGGRRGLLLCGSLFWRTEGQTKCKKESREKPHFVRFDYVSAHGLLGVGLSTTVLQIIMCITYF